MPSVHAAVATLLLAGAAAEGLYKEGSPVESFTVEAEVPLGPGNEQPLTLMEFYSSCACPFLSRLPLHAATLLYKRGWQSH
jgi:hypothetical protein